MRRWNMVAVALGVYVVVLVVTAPATLVDAGLQRGSQGRLRLAQANGTVWSGSGQMEIRDASGTAGIAKAFAWHVLPESLLRGHLVCEIELDLPAKRFPVTVSLTSVELAGADISLPATVLGLGIPKLAPLGLTGEVLIHITTLSVARNAMQGNATVRWRAAGSTLTPVSPLGDYEVRLYGEAMTMHAFLRTIKGPLQLDGEGSWTRGENPAFLAMARVPAQHLQQLAPLLRLIAVERGEGRFELQLN